MKRLLFIITLMTFFQSQAYGQSLISNYYKVQPNPATEGQMVTIGFLTGCRHWEDHDFSVNGFVIDYEVTYYDCLVGVPTPEYYEYFDLGELPVGNYQVNMSINVTVTSPGFTIQETIAFGVLPPTQQVPMNSTLIYLLLGSLLLLTGGLFLQRASRKRLKKKKP